MRRTFDKSTVAVVILGLGALLSQFSSASCAVTPKAALRRDAESQLRGCLRISTSPAQRDACVAESGAWCKAHGLEATCATDDYWTHPDWYYR